MEAFENASLYLPIWILFFTRELGLTVTAAITLGMTRWVVMALCEVPTGAWADRFGRVRIYRIGQFFYALSYLPFLLTHNFALLFVVQILGGFFGSMAEGAVHPVVKETYTLAKLSDKKYTHYLSNCTVVLYLSRLTAGILGAWLYSKHPYGPFGIQVFIVFGAFVSSLFMKEFRTEKTTSKTSRQHIREAVGYVWRHSYLRNYVFALVTVALLAESIWTSVQPSLDYHGIAPQYFGIMFGVIAVFSAAGAYISRHIAGKMNGIKIKFYMAITAFAAAVTMLSHNNVVLVLSLALLGLAFGFTQPIDMFNIQKYTAPHIQSTVLSLRSMLYTGSFSLSSVVVGRYVDLYGTSTMLIILAIQAAIGMVVVALILSMKQSQEPQPGPIKPTFPTLPVQ
jgi:MFS family permease